MGLSNVTGGNVDIEVLNCTFNTPTDTGTLYYHCVPPVNEVSGCTFTAPSFAFGAFFYLEPGSYNGSAIPQSDQGSTYTLRENTVTLARNWAFDAVFNHSNGASGNHRIEDNKITGMGSGQNIFQLTGNAWSASGKTVTSVTIKGNTLSGPLTQVSDQIGNAIGKTTTQ
jgi:hypothetical protein